MDIFKLKGINKNYIWGGKSLFKYGKVSDDECIAESWELSYQPGNESIVNFGPFKGKKINEILTKEDLGKNCNNFSSFPLLIKLIDANDNLSIQVHPDDEYALKNENSLGKSEMWYVLDCTKDAYLHIGLNKCIDKKELAERIASNTILDVMNHIKVTPGDCFYIPSGTLHAIGKGCLIYEAQENSNITYRVYDYDRLDKFGNRRELHINKAKEVANLNKTLITNLKNNTPLIDCPYFKITKLVNPNEIVTDENSFACITFLVGSGTINDIPFAKGDSFFIPANKQGKISGNCVCIIAKT